MAMVYAPILMNAPRVRTLAPGPATAVIQPGRLCAVATSATALELPVTALILMSALMVSSDVELWQLA